MGTTNKIAFVYYPHNPDAVRLETMPFASNVVAGLADLGWDIDLFVWESSEGEIYKTLLKDVRPRFGRHPSPSPMNRIRPLGMFINFALRPVHQNYRCVFGLGQIGSYVGALLAKRSGCSFVYLNDEFPSCHGPSNWARLERWAAARACLLVLPSAGRFEPLAEELGLPASVAHAVLPNMPQRTRPADDVDWHARLGIPPGTKLFLHNGSIAEWACIPELLSSVSYWPSGAALVLNGRTRQSAQGRRELAHLEQPGRVYWTSEPLNEPMLHSLITRSTATFALYRNLGPNIETIGTSSGKLMRSIACGTPAIVSKFDSLDFVAQEGLGVQVVGPRDYPAAVEDVLANEARYRASCRIYSESTHPYSASWSKFIEAVKASAGLDLSNPGLRSGFAPMSYQQKFLD